MKDLIPENHGILHAIGLAGTGDLFATGAAGVLECIADDPFGALTRKNGRLDRHFLLFPLVDTSSCAGVFSLGILPNAYNVYILGALVGQGTAHSGQQAHRTEVDVLVERLAYRQ